MSRKGNCFDNAAMDIFFGTLKAEFFHFAAPDSIDALEAGVHDSYTDTTSSAARGSQKHWHRFVFDNKVSWRCGRHGS